MLKKAILIITHNVIHLDGNFRLVGVRSFKWQMSHFGMKQLQLTRTATHLKSLQPESCWNRNKINSVGNCLKEIHTGLYV